MNLMTDKHHIAVITGDVISSRQSGPEVWMPALKSILARFGEQPSDWEIHRGDAFQLMIETPSLALSTAMAIKAGFKSTPGLDLRMAIGIGSLSFRSKRVGESSGDAFIHSGALVDKLDNMHTTLAVSSPWADFDDDVNPSLALAAALMDRWLPSYAESIAAYLAEPELTQQQLGDKLGIAQNTLSERQTKAYRRQLVKFEEIFRNKLNHLLNVRS